MSCVIGYVDQKTGDIYLAGDSAGVVPDRFVCRTIPNQKAFVKGNSAFGVSGSCRICQLIRYGFSIPVQEEGMNDDEFMCTTFTRSLCTYLTDNEAIQILNEGESVFDATFLIVYNGILYRVESDFACFPVPNYDVIGCGEDFAKSVFYAFEAAQIEIDPIKKIEIAMTAACEFSIGVRPPFHYIKIQKSTINNAETPPTNPENI